MKKLYRNCFVCLFVCLFSINLQAKEVNKQTAEKVAINAFAGLDNNKNASDFQVKEILTVKSEEETSFYIVNFKPTGFIILSASDAAVPILGSSTESNFSFENLPPQLSYLFDCYKTQIKEIEKQKISPTKEIKQKWDKYAEASSITSNSLKSANTILTQVDPLVPTIWNQNAGWNQSCPYDASSPQGYGNHVPAGCGAVALAQILYRWGCQVNESGNNSVNSAYGTLYADFTEADYQWSSMSPSSPDNYNAKLIYDCGIAINTVYGSGESTSATGYVKNALINYFGFKSIADEYYSNEYTDSEWKNLLKSDLNLGRPIFYSGSDDIGPDTSVHAWIIDGYDTSDRFRCNWGWGGLRDGYYYLNNLNPSPYVYTPGFVAILNIEPVMPNCVEISGGTTICSSGASYNVPNLPSGATVTWAKSSNITTVSSQPSNPCTFQANGTGTGWIEATVNYNGSATLDRKEVFVGLTASFSGNTSVSYGSTGTWTATATCGMSPYTYEWWLGEEGTGMGAYVVATGEELTLLSVPRLSKALSQQEESLSNPITNQPIQQTCYTLYLRVLDADNNEYITAQQRIIAYGNVDLVSRSLERPVMGLTEKTDAISFNTFPNPANSATTIELVGTANGSIDVSATWDMDIFDQNTMLKIKKTNIKGKNCRISTSGWKEGIYLVRVKVGAKIVSGKLIVKQ